MIASKWNKRVVSPWKPEGEWSFLVGGVKNSPLNFGSGQEGGLYRWEKLGGDAWEHVLPQQEGSWRRDRLCCFYSWICGTLSCPSPEESRARSTVRVLSNNVSIVLVAHKDSRNNKLLLTWGRSGLRTRRNLFLQRLENEESEHSIHWHPMKF